MAGSVAGHDRFCLPGSVYPHSLSTSAACYGRAMDDALSHLPEMLRIAAKRRPRRARKVEGGTHSPQNNYIAEAPKNPIGAMPGNRNAVTHGLGTVDNRARRAALRALARRTEIMADDVNAMIELGLNPSDRAALLAILAEPRNG